MTNLKTLIKEIIYKFDQVGFSPYIKPLTVGNKCGVFFFGTKIAQKWYDPIRTIPLLEYEWVLSNINLRNQKILDGGCHHGHYSVVFALGSEGTCQLLSVDPVSTNICLTQINLLLNNYKPKILECAIYNENGVVSFENVSNGKIIESGSKIVNSRTLQSISPNVNIVKLDIEGAEFDVVPKALDSLNDAHTWIVEIHPLKRPADDLVSLFIEKGYEVNWVNPRSTKVEKYKLGNRWDFHHATVICTR